MFPVYPFCHSLQLFSSRSFQVLLLVLAMLFTVFLMPSSGAPNFYYGGTQLRSAETLTSRWIHMGAFRRGKH